MTRDHFCGVDAGPRTIFTIEARYAYSIEKFSFFHGVNSEHEVLILPLSKFQVKFAQKNIIDPISGNPINHEVPTVAGITILNTSI